MSQRCGQVALVGRPNAGKSTLLNALVGANLSAICRKAQMTRRDILGVQTRGDDQILWVDTPGMHAKAKRGLNRQMNQKASDALFASDIVVFLVNPPLWSKDEVWIHEHLVEAGIPTVIGLNKMDQYKGSEAELADYVAQIEKGIETLGVVPLCARKKQGLDTLLFAITQHLPEKPFVFDPEMLTDLPAHDQIEESVRLQVMKFCHQEIPYATHVQVEKIDDKGDIIHIHACLWVESEMQKRMMIGKGGVMLKRIGTSARLRLEKQFDKKIFLKLFVKAKANWPDQLPSDLGFE